MKKFAPYLLSLLVPVLLTGCSAEPSEECKQLQQENAILREATQARDQQIDEVTKTMAEVESNLSNIQQTQTEIGNLKGDPKNPTQKEKIENYIKGINTYIQENRGKVSALEEKYKKSKVKSAGLERLIGRLRSTIKLKEAQIDSLSTANHILITQVGDLTTAVQERDAQIADKQGQLAAKTEEAQQLDSEKNTAWYVIGTKKELLSSGVIMKKGGVLGMGKTEQLAPTADKQNFKTLSIRNTTDIDLGVAKKAELISSHPGGSYTLIKNGNSITLKITNPDKFWNVSKYLVVQLD